MRKCAACAKDAADRPRMVTAMVMYGLDVRDDAARQPKFHHARRLEPDVGPEWAKGVGNGPRIGPALAFA